MLQPKCLEYTNSFLSNYNHLPPIIQKKVDRQVQMLSSDIGHPSLRAKKMFGQNGIWEARVDHKYRFTFEVAGNMLYLHTVGTHDIYRLING